LLIGSEALGQGYPNPRTRYLVIDVGIAPGCSTRASMYGTSLNDCGDVVGYTNDSHIDGCRVSPWIWSYCEGCESPLPEGGAPEALAGVQEQASAASSVDLSVILAIAGQPDAAAFGNWLAGLTPEQVAQFAAVVEAISSSGGDQ
jgi:hypothetical protein